MPIAEIHWRSSRRFLIHPKYIYLLLPKATIRKCRPEPRTTIGVLTVYDVVRELLFEGDLGEPFLSIHRVALRGFPHHVQAMGVRLSLSPFLFPDQSMANFLSQSGYFRHFGESKRWGKPLKEQATQWRMCTERCQRNPAPHFPSSTRIEANGNGTSEIEGGAGRTRRLHLLT